MKRSKLIESRWDDFKAYFWLIFTFFATAVISYHLVGLAI